MGFSGGDESDDSEICILAEEITKQKQQPLLGEQCGPNKEGCNKTISVKAIDRNCKKTGFEPEVSNSKNKLIKSSKKADDKKCAKSESKPKVCDKKDEGKRTTSQNKNKKSKSLSELSNNKNMGNQITGGKANNNKSKRGKSSSEVSNNKKNKSHWMSLINVNLGRVVGGKAAPNTKCNSITSGKVPKGSANSVRSGKVLNGSTSTSNKVEFVDITDDTEGSSNREMSSPVAKVAPSTKSMIACIVCGEKFEQFIELKKHLLSHSYKKYNCDHCELSFPSIQKLRDHENLHSQEEIAIRMPRVNLQHHHRELQRKTMIDSSKQKTDHQLPFKIAAIVEDSGNSMKVAGDNNNVQENGKSNVGLEQLMPDDGNNKVVLIEDLVPGVNVCPIPDATPGPSSRNAGDGNIIQEKRKMGESIVGPLTPDSSSNGVVLVQDLVPGLCHAPDATQGPSSRNAGDDKLLQENRKIDVGMVAPLTSENSNFGALLIPSLAPGVNVGPVPDDSQGPSSSKPYSCPICKKGLSKSSVSNHMKLHMGEKPYHCPLCEKKFVKKGSLKNHLLKHNNENASNLINCAYPKDMKDAASSAASVTFENALLTGTKCNFTTLPNGVVPFKAYSCPICFKGLSKDYVKVHMKLHSGERPHRCHFCIKGFISKSSLKKHILKRHGTEEIADGPENKTTPQNEHTHDIGAARNDTNRFNGDAVVDDSISVMLSQVVAYHTSNTSAERENVSIELTSKEKDHESSLNQVSTENSAEVVVIEGETHPAEKPSSLPPSETLVSVGGNMQDLGLEIIETHSNELRKGNNDKVSNTMSHNKRKANDTRSVCSFSSPEEEFNVQLLKKMKSSGSISVMAVNSVTSQRDKANVGGMRSDLALKTKDKDGASHSDNTKSDPKTALETGNSVAYTSRKIKPYACSICKRRYMALKALNKHMLIKHPAKVTDSSANDVVPHKLSVQIGIVESDINRLHGDLKVGECNTALLNEVVANSKYNAFPERENTSNGLTSKGKDQEESSLNQVNSTEKSAEVVTLEEIETHLPVKPSSFIPEERLINIERNKQVSVIEQVRKSNFEKLKKGHFERGANNNDLSHNKRKASDAKSVCSTSSFSSSEEEFNVQLLKKWKNSGTITVMADNSVTSQKDKANVGGICSDLALKTKDKIGLLHSDNTKSDPMSTLKTGNSVSKTPNRIKQYACSLCRKRHITLHALNKHLSIKHAIQEITDHSAINAIPQNTYYVHNGAAKSDINRYNGDWKVDESNSVLLREAVTNHEANGSAERGCGSNKLTSKEKDERKDMDSLNQVTVKSTEVTVMEGGACPLVKPNSPLALKQVISNSNILKTVLEDKNKNFEKLKKAKFEKVANNKSPKKRKADDAGSVCSVSSQEEECNVAQLQKKRMTSGSSSAIADKSVKFQKEKVKSTEIIVIEGDACPLVKSNLPLPLEQVISDSNIQKTVLEGKKKYFEKLKKTKFKKVANNKSHKKRKADDVGSVCSISSQEEERIVAQLQKKRVTSGVIADKSVKFQKEKFNTGDMHCNLASKRNDKDAKVNSGNPKIDPKNIFETGNSVGKTFSKIKLNDAAIPGSSLKSRKDGRNTLHNSCTATPKDPPANIEIPVSIDQQAASKKNIERDATQFHKLVGKFFDNLKNRIIVDKKFEKLKANGNKVEKILTDVDNNEQDSDIEVIEKGDNVKLKKASVKSFASNDSQCKGNKDVHKTNGVCSPSLHQRKDSASNTISSDKVRRKSKEPHISKETPGGRSISKKPSNKNHKRSQSLPNISCKLCSSSFFWSLSLEQHMKRKHSKHCIKE